VKGPFKLKLWAKIFIACAAITTVAVSATGIMSYVMLQKGRRDRGRFLRKHLLRYIDYQQGLGQSLQAACRMIASDEALVQTLARHHRRIGQTSTARPTTRRNARRPITAAPTTRRRTGRLVGPIHGPTDKAVGHGPALSGPSILKATTTAATTTALWTRLARSLDESIDPDLFAIVDARGHLLFKAPRSAPTVSGAKQRVITDILNRVYVSGSLLVVEAKVYLVSGAPITDRSGNVVGAVLVAIRVKRYYDQYRRQSDSRPKMQHRLVLVSTENNVLSSVFSKDLWSSLGTALRPDRRRKAWEGRKKIPVISFAGHFYDFFSVPAVGYQGADRKRIGTLYVLRLRRKEKVFEQLVGWLLPAALAIAIASLVMAWILSLWIASPIRKFTRATREIVQGEGDLTKRIDVRSGDELGELAGNLNRLFARLEHITAQVQQASFQVGASSTQLCNASKNMLDGAKEQALKTESSTAAVTELSSSIQQVADNAMETTKVAQRSGDEVSAAVMRMNEIRLSVEDVGTQITHLGESGNRIGKIVEVIRQISEQTSLLALNASIEAAHAGEHGKGFAVVADEVSSLAKRVGQSARDIEELIASITDQTLNAVRTMNATIQEVEQGTSLVKNTLGNIQRIVGVFQETARAVQEQALASDEIARNMDVVQRIAQEVLASSEEAVLQGERLSALAFKLEESVRGFRVAQTEIAALPQRPALSPPNPSKLSDH